MKTFLSVFVALGMIVLFTAGCEYSGMVNDIGQNARSLKGLFSNSTDAVEEAKDFGEATGLAGILGSVGVKKADNEVSSSQSLDQTRKEIEGVEKALDRLASESTLATTPEFVDVRTKTITAKAHLSSLELAKSQGWGPGDVAYDTYSRQLDKSMKELKSSVHKLAAVGQTRQARAD